MQGRNGPDNLFRFSLIVSLGIALVSMFIRNPWVRLPFTFLYYGALIYCVFRMLSKNVYKRRMENSKYLAIKGRVKSFFNRKKAQFRDRKTHVYKKCPACKATLRLPKKKGKHTVSCPRCKNSFETRI